MTKAVEPTPQELKDKKLYHEWGLTDAEYCLIEEKVLGRMPNYTELGLFAVMWSEHCSYKNSKAVLRLFPNEGKRRQVLRGPGEGAGVVDIGDEQAVVFKTESHNHPSAVEPYEGAATGVGGILRDIFSMGARPIASMNSIRFGQLDNPHTKYIFEEVVHGISNYGNSMGIPTVGGETIFDSSYKGNPLVNAFNLGLINHEDVQVGQAHGEGNSILYVGAKTGRDGIHGASFASQEFSDEEEANRSAVQVGDPFLEKLLMEACLEVIQKHQDILVGIQDMGAAGLVSSSSEMASKANIGVTLNLDDVPQRETEMTPYEMMLSESQERMLLCVKKGKEQAIIDLFARYNLDAVIIGEVIKEPQYRLYHQGVVVADIPVHALAEQAPEYTNEKAQPERMKKFAEQASFVPTIADVNETVKALLKDPNLASKRSVYETYDSMVQANTVVGPGSDAAVIRVRDKNKAIAMTMDCNANFVYLNPKIGGKQIIVESVANLVASGAEPLAITDCLNFGNPNKPEIFYEMWESASGIAEACEVFDTPVISGNVSLYNEYNGQAVKPTPSIGMVGVVKKLADVTTIAFKQAGDLIFLIGETAEDYHGSAIQRLQQDEASGEINDFDLHQLFNRSEKVLEAIQSDVISAAHDVSEGGVLIALLEAAFGTIYGFDVNVDMSTAQLFSETVGRYIVTVPANKQDKLEQILGADAQLIGKVTNERIGQLQVKGQNEKVDIAEMETIWEETIPCLMNSTAAH